MSNWAICPIWFIPATLLAACIEALCDYFHLSERLIKRYGWQKHEVRRWLRRIIAGISLIVTLLIIIAISILLKFNLLKWEPMGQGAD